MSGLILLSGATGFVGRQVLAALGEAGASVRVVTRAGSNAQLLECEAIEDRIVTSDLFAESTERCAKICRGVDTVVHAAWYVEPGQYLQSAKNLDCLEGTLRLARGAAQAGVRRFVGVGTCFEYDLKVTAGVLSVDTPLRPLTPYAGAKAAAFQMLSQWLPAQGVKFSWCRLFYLWGEAEDARRLVPYLRARLTAGEPAELTSGEQIRDFLDVREAGRLVAQIALSDHEGAVNVCSGVAVTVREMAERIADEYGRRDLLRFGARPDNCMDPPCVLGDRRETLQ